MISIELDEKSVFTYCVEDKSIGIWDHQKEGKWKGPIIGQVGKIKFCEEWQVDHFKEMLEFMLEKMEACNDSGI